MEELLERLARLEKLSLLAAKNVLTIDDAVLLLGLSKCYIYKLTCAKKIPHYKPGAKLLYFDRGELEAWAKRNRINTVEETGQKAAAYCAKGV